MGNQEFGNLRPLVVVRTETNLAMCNTLELIVVNVDHLARKV